MRRTGDGGAGHELRRVGGSEMGAEPDGDPQDQGDADLEDPAQVSNTERRRLQNREAARRFQNKKKKYIDDLKGQISALVRNVAPPTPGPLGAATGGRTRARVPARVVRSPGDCARAHGSLSLSRANDTHAPGRPRRRRPSWTPRRRSGRI